MIVSNLDDKLRDILGVRDQKDELVAQIKQAFADERYIQIPDKIRTIRITEELDELPTGFMTGQEWFQRFNYEFKGTRWYDQLTGSHDEVIEAAKKAAGIE